MSMMTIVTFIIALAIAWFIASDGNLFNSGDDPIVRERTESVEANRPNTTPETPASEIPRPGSEPRKGPSSADRQDPIDSARDEIETAVDGVLEQFCGSSFIFNQARDAGGNALRAYLDRCSRIDGPFVDDARRELGL
jgi:hypothetical protein